MSDSHSKRKYAGEPHADKRRGRAPDIERLPPHKKPRTWSLSVEWTQTITRRRSQSFPSKAARDEARVRIERYFREEEQHRKSKRRGYFPGYWNSPLSSFSDEETKTIKEGPVYTETYEESSDNG